MKDEICVADLFPNGSTGAKGRSKGAEPRTGDFCLGSTKRWRRRYGGGGMKGEGFILGPSVIIGLSNYLPGVRQNFSNRAGKGISGLNNV
jgi:hypothetical protein